MKPKFFINDDGYGIILYWNPESSPPDNKPPSEEKMILEQADDNYCGVAAMHVSHSSSKFTVGNKNLLIMKYQVNAAKQVVVQF